MSDEKLDQGTVQIALRIAPDLRERIKSAAEANNRSVNKELTATLEEKYPAPAPNVPTPYAVDLMKRFQRATPDERPALLAELNLELRKVNMSASISEGNLTVSMPGVAFTPETISHMQDLRARLRSDDPAAASEGEAHSFSLKDIRDMLREITAELARRESEGS